MPMTTANLNMETAGSSAPLLHEILTKVNKRAAIKADKRGQIIHVETISIKEEISVCESLKMFHPTIEPIIVWLVETGNPNFVIQ